MRVYALILASFLMILSLWNILKGETKNERIANFISFILYLPLWYYILKN